MVALSSGGGATAIGPAVSEESETAAPVSKQEQQMLRVGGLHLYTFKRSWFECWLVLLFNTVSGIEFCGRAVKKASVSSCVE